MLARLYADGTSEGSLRSIKQQFQPAVYKWQLFRQARIDRVLKLNRQMDLRRLPKKLGTEDTNTEESKVSMRAEFEWLFQIDLDAAVAECTEESGEEKM